MVIEIARVEDAEEIVSMIERSIRACFPAFYPPNSVDYVVEEMSVDTIARRMGWTRFYVVKDEGKIIGCGSIGNYYDSKTEGCIFNVFVEPSYHKQGIGRKIVETLENDDITKDFNRIEIHAAISAIPFYKKMGYEHKNGSLIFEDGHFDMEKFIKDKK